MNAEQFAWAYIKSEFLYPKRLLFQSEDLYHACMEETLALGEKTRGRWCSPFEKKGQRAKKKRMKTEKREREGVVRLIKTLQQALKMDRRNLKSQGLSSRRSRSSGSGRMEYSSPGQSFPRPSGFPISTMPSQAKR